MSLAQSLFFFSLICIGSLVFLVRNKPDNTMLDPGILFVTGVFISMAPTALLILNYFIPTTNFWPIADHSVFSLVLQLHAFMILLFTVGYLFLTRNMRVSPTHISAVHSSYVWIPVYLLVSIASYIVQIIYNNTYLSAQMDNIQSAATIIAASVVVLKLKTTGSSLFVIGILMILLMLVINPILEVGPYTVNKGGAVALGLGIASYVERVRWKGKLITFNRFVLGCISLMLLLGTANYIEAIINGSNIGLLEYIYYVLISFEPQIANNVATIIEWVDSGEEILRLGQTYSDAVIELIYPLNSTETLTSWYTDKKLNGINPNNQGFAFSIIAEGYLNFGAIGGVLAASVCAILVAFCIRYFYHSEKLWVIGPILYSLTISNCYFLYRYNIEYVLKRIEYVIFDVIVLVMLFVVIRRLLVVSPMSISEKRPHSREVL